MKRLHFIRQNHWPAALVVAGLVVLAMSLLLITGRAAALEGSSLHPTFPLLDADGKNVLDTGNPVSTLATCGACHDTDFITEHNAHADVLVGSLKAPAGEAVMTDRETGMLIGLEEAVDIVEVNCFLCHSTAPDNTARLAELAAGSYEWANTATLLGTGVIEKVDGGYRWNPEAFDANGDLLPEFIGIQDPAVENCGQCHGVATSDVTVPINLHTCGTEQRQTITTGQIYSPSRISDSGLNISGKETLARTWDVHAERVVGCVDCHYSLNNPAYATEPGESRPAHLIFDPRRLEPGEYLERPLHEFARSSDDPITESACQSCHETRSTHAWLPYTNRHLEAVACETCHTARLEAPARQVMDWTVLGPTGAPAAVCRGMVDECTGGPRLIVGYEPALLPRSNDDGTTTYAPYNLITVWYWVYGGAMRPVPLADVQAAYFEGDAYHPDVLAAFDANGNGTLDGDELIIDSEAKETVIADRLRDTGHENPRIVAEVQTYAINHSVTHGDYATRDCQACHGSDSRLAQPVLLTDNPPGGVLPSLDGNPLGEAGDIVVDDAGAVYFQPHTGSTGDDTYVLGYSSSRLVDRVGAIIFLGVLAGVIGHGGLRVLTARRREPQEPELRKLYVYSIYNRLWHWLQTAAIMILILTGLIIHKPDMFGMFSFRYVVQVHNIIAAILVVNAGLALFYHLTTGQIRQFLPEPRGFFGQSIEQARFYLQGIFKGSEHPFEKTPEHKLNPLQQITYLGLLNVLLPLQGITGIMMWGAQRWPALVDRLGGLPFLAPLHTLIAWLFVSFIVMHVYLTTTGYEPMASLKGMIMGWDEVEVHAGSK